MKVTFDRIGNLFIESESYTENQALNYWADRNLKDGRKCEVVIQLFNNHADIEKGKE